MERGGVGVERGGVGVRGGVGGEGGVCVVRGGVGGEGRSGCGEGRSVWRGEECVERGGVCGEGRSVGRVAVYVIHEGPNVGILIGLFYLRSTTVYLADRRYDMLPGVLSANVCSLLSNVNRYVHIVVPHD